MSAKYYLLVGGLYVHVEDWRLRLTRLKLTRGQRFLIFGGRRRCRPAGGAPAATGTIGHGIWQQWQWLDHDHTIGGVMKHEEVEAVQFVVPTNTLLLHSIGKIQ